MRHLIASLFTVCFSFTILAASAPEAAAAQTMLPALSHAAPDAKLSPVTQVRWGPHCRRARERCRYRHGHGPDFRRCMRRRDCAVGPHRRQMRRENRRCGRWENACAANWGYGNNNYYGCLKYYNCR
jgi:hypothetical protein